MSSEFDFARDHHGMTTTDLARVTLRSLEAAFCDYHTKGTPWETRVAPAYLDAGVAVDPSW